MPVKAGETKQVTFLSSLPGVWITMFRKPVTLKIDSLPVGAATTPVSPDVGWAGGSQWGSLGLRQGIVCRVRPWGAEEQMESTWCSQLCWGTVITDTLKLSCFITCSKEIWTPQMQQPHYDLVELIFLLVRCLAAEGSFALSAYQILSWGFDPDSSITADRCICC